MVEKDVQAQNMLLAERERTALLSTAHLPHLGYGLGHLGLYNHGVLPYSNPYLPSKLWLW